MRDKGGKIIRYKYNKPVGVLGIEPSTSRSRTERSSDELHSVFI